jgi:hypothetical protein
MEQQQQQQQPVLGYEADKKVADVEAKMPFLQVAQPLYPQQPVIVMSHPPQAQVMMMPTHNCCSHQAPPAPPVKTLKADEDGFPISLPMVT